MGTTFCSVGVFHPGTGEVEVIADEQGRQSIPSVVSFTTTEVLAGHEALDLADSNAQNTFYDAKRFIGKIFEPGQLEQESARYPFKVSSEIPNLSVSPHQKSKGVSVRLSLQVINNNGSAEFVVFTNRSFTVTPEFIGSRLLLKMKKMAELQLGVPIQKAVISVPAEFDERQRNYTERAANLAGQYLSNAPRLDVFIFFLIFSFDLPGLEILRVINEPTAAAMAYGLHKVDVFNVLVVDLGGGTLDVSLLNKQGGMFLTRAMAGTTFIRKALKTKNFDIFWKF